ncbi:MAG: diguanylate cyclase [Pseudomonadota bacterium]
MTPTPFSLIPPWLHELRSVAVALLDGEGRVLEANAGFSFTLTEAADGNHAAARFVEPSFARLLEMPTDQNQVVYDGVITLSIGEGISRALSGKIYRFNQLLLLAAELDITAFEQLSRDNEQVRRELEETKRQLARRNEALQKAEQEAEELKHRDSLTRLANLKQLDIRLAEEIQRWERYRRPLALVLLDIDDFASINEQYGRRVGDEMLQHVATILKNSLRSIDLVARYGGQEFAMLLPETNEMGAMIVAERMRMDLESMLILPLLRPITASFGVAMLLPEEKHENFYARVERALRHSKENGKNCVTMAGVVAECDHIYRGAEENMEESGHV